MSTPCLAWLLAPMLLACASAQPSPAQVPESTDPASLQRGCEGGKARACVTLGAMLAAGHDVPVDRTMARQRLEQGCKLGDTEGCFALATMLYEGSYLDQDERRALVIYQGLCDAGRSIGCVLTGIVHRNGRGVPKDDVRAHALFERACVAGERLGCLLRGAKPTPDSPLDQRDLEHAEALCDLSNGLACGLLGFTYLTADGVPRDAHKGQLFLERGCAAGSSLSCVLLGTELYTGTLLTKDHGNARRYLQLGCDGRQGGACTVLGLSCMQHELGFAEDHSKAASYFEKGCALHDHDSCASLAMLSMQGDGIPKDTARALRLLDDSCHAASADACGKLGAALYEAGDKERSWTAFDRACTLGHQLACSAVQKLGLRAP